MSKPSNPHFSHFLLLLPLLSLFHPASSQQTTGTITLTLSTTNDESASTLSLPINTLFTPSSPRNQGVEIHVSSGTSLPIAQDAITCQCFADAAGTQRLGETFTTVFPGARLAAEQPVEIGAIFCSDEEGLARQIAGSGAGEKAAVVPEAVAATTTSGVSVSSTSIVQTSTSTSAGATAAAAQNNETPTAFIRFNLSPDPSDDSSTQMPVPIDGSIVETGGKSAASVEVATIDGLVQSGDSGLVCQVFADAGAEEPLAWGFGFEQVMGLDGEGAKGVKGVGAVGCAVLGGGHLGGRVGLVRS
ncbi:MAG: hypothetical protein Q9184_003425 [Pyrenodesmia sp. 2 TL-2023]